MNSAISRKNRRNPLKEKQNRKTPQVDQPKKNPEKEKTKTLGLRSAWKLNFQSLRYGNEAVEEWPKSVEQSGEWEDEWPKVARGDESIPGNL